MKILKALGKYDGDDVPKAVGLFRQQIEATRRGAFVYMVQYIRAATPQYRDEFFEVVYGGKYNIENPPPFDGWRKKIWDEVMGLKKHSYVGARYLTALAKNEKRK